MTGTLRSWSVSLDSRFALDTLCMSLVSQSPWFGMMEARSRSMQANQKAWEAMGYSWRAGNGTHDVRMSLALVDPFARASNPVWHNLRNTARNVALQAFSLCDGGSVASDVDYALDMIEFFGDRALTDHIRFV